MDPAVRFWSRDIPGVQGVGPGLSQPSVCVCRVGVGVSGCLCQWSGCGCVCDCTCHWGGRECVLIDTRWWRVPVPEGPELTSLAPKAFAVFLSSAPGPPALGLWLPPGGSGGLFPDILDKGSPVEAGTGPLQPPHQHRAHLNWTSRPPSPPSSARGLGFKATVPQVPGLGPDREPPPSPC